MGGAVFDQLGLALPLYFIVHEKQRMHETNEISGGVAICAMKQQDVRESDRRERAKSITTAISCEIENGI